MDVEYLDSVCVCVLVLYSLQCLHGVDLADTSKTDCENDICGQAFFVCFRFEICFILQFCFLQGKISLTNVSERKDKMRLGMTLTSNPKDNSFVVS